MSVNSYYIRLYGNYSFCYTLQIITKRMYNSVYILVNCFLLCILNLVQVIFFLHFFRFRIKKRCFACDVLLFKITCGKSHLLHYLAIFLEINFKNMYILYLHLMIDDNLTKKANYMFLLLSPTSKITTQK